MTGWTTFFLIVGIIILVSLVAWGIWLVVKSIGGAPLTLTKEWAPLGLKISWNVTPLQYKSTYTLLDETTNKVILQHLTSQNYYTIPESETTLPLGHKLRFNVSSTPVGNPNGAVMKGSISWESGAPGN